MYYEVRAAHKISPRHTDVQTIESETLAQCDPTDRKVVGKALRDAGVLCTGMRLRSSRRSSEGNIVAFPAGSTIHAFIARPIVETDLYAIHVGWLTPASESYMYNAGGPYGNARSHNLYEFMVRNHRPLCSESESRTYVYYVADTSRPERWVEAGGFFVEPGADWRG